MNARHVRNKAKGQSLPLIALMIVVLFGMVGLAVDVGNTYAEQRNLVRSSNAAALAGMNAYITGGADSSKDQAVYNAIVKSFESNGINIAPLDAPAQPGQRQLNATYLGADGNPVGCGNVGCGAAPAGAIYIRVEVGGEVNTFFARVVGRPTLPVNATSFASQCPPTRGVFPIAVRESYLTTSGFVAPSNPAEMGYYGLYSDDFYSNKTWRRIYVHDPVATPNGGFSWLRWHADQGNRESGGNTPALRAMFNGQGNLYKHFDEAPWPAGSDLPRPDAYPQRPKEFSPPEWIYGNSGFGMDRGPDGVYDELLKHSINQKRTMMFLPIYKTFVGQGVNGNYYVSRLGAFLLKGFGKDNGKPYIELVYLGEANNEACLVTAVQRSNSLGVTGSVYFRPRSLEQSAARQPLQYLFVLDVSGSMSWNFLGEGLRNGRIVQCGASQDLDRNARRQDCGDSGSAYPTVEQRRIYIAKQAIKQFINNDVYMNPAMGDRAQILAFTGVGNNPQRHTQTLPPGGWSDDKDALLDAVDDAGKVNNDPYLTEGGTPSATALNRAAALLANAPRTFNGQQYRRIVVFLTDGVANFFLNGGYNDANCPGTRYPGEDVNCQSGEPIGGRERPINAMGSQGMALRQGGYNSTTFVIALAGVAENGLRSHVAEDPTLYFPAPAAADVQPIFDKIGQRSTSGGQCIPQGGDAWVNTIRQENAASIPPPNNVAYPVVGYVTLTYENGQPLPDNKGRVPIQVDPQTGFLTYRVDDLAPNTYKMQAWVAYRGVDQESRVYGTIMDLRDLEPRDSITFNLGPSDTLGKLVPLEPLYLDLNGALCAQP